MWESSKTEKGGEGHSASEIMGTSPISFLTLYLNIKDCSLGWEDNIFIIQVVFTETCDPQIIRKEKEKEGPKKPIRILFIWL